jgi:glycosyltransferase involved in cell wall biosynthesis
MKICEVNSGLIPIPVDGAGAVEKIILSLSTELGKLGHEVHIVDVATKLQFECPRNIVFRRAVNLPLTNKGISHLARGIYFMFASACIVGKLIKEDKIDIIHIHNQFSGFLITILNKYFWKKPLVFTTHNQEIFEKNIKNTIIYWPERFILRNARVVVCVSPSVQKLLISKLGIDSQRLEQIYSGVDFGVTNMRLQKEIDFDFKIIIVARIVPRKNQLMVIEAAKEVVKEFPKAKFQFIGPVDDDNYYEQLKKLWP